MRYDYSEGKDELIKIIKEGLGWECGTSVDCQIGDHLLDLSTPIKDLRIIMVGNILFPNDIDPKSINDPLSDPRGVKNRSIFFNYRNEEIFELMEQKKYPFICSLFTTLFCPLENKTLPFRTLFSEEDTEDDDYFENLDLNDAEVFVERLEEFIQELRKNKY